MFRFLRSHIAIDLSAEPVARMYSEAGLNERALIASPWPPLAWREDALVSGFRWSMIWRVRSSETVPIRELCRG